MKKARTDRSRPTAEQKPLATELKAYIGLPPTEEQLEDVEYYARETVHEPDLDVLVEARDILRVVAEVRRQRLAKLHYEARHAFTWFKLRNGIERALERAAKDREVSSAGLKSRDWNRIGELLEEELQREAPTSDDYWIKLAAEQIQGDPSCFGDASRIADIIRGHTAAVRRRS